MDYTVADFYSKFNEKLVLLSGKDGLNRRVVSVGILDYELDPSLKDKYAGDNFHSDMIIIATFLYAKKSPYLISDAVRYLVGKGCSALIIRNVFNLEIPESTIRYAESKNFPIMLIHGHGLFFESCVYEVLRHSEQLRSIDFYEDELNLLLNNEHTDADIVKRVRNIIPSIKHSYFILYAMPQTLICENDYLEATRLYRESSIFNTSTKVIKYGNSILLVFSSDTLTSEYNKKTFMKLVNFLEDSFHTKFRTGISDPHYYLSDFKDAFFEAKYASVYPSSGYEAFILYDQIGIYQLVLPHCRDYSFVKYCRRILDPIQNYDIENGTTLYETLFTFISQEADIKKSAASLDIHENTIRYRLDKIKDICGLDYRNPFDASQLVTAISIDFSRSLLGKEEF